MVKYNENMAALEDEGGGLMLSEVKVEGTSGGECSLVDVS